MQKKTVCILGGSGFVGRHICSQLVSAGYRVRVLSRRKSACNELSVLPDLNILETDVYDQHKLNHAIEGAHIVINLIGILNEKQHNGDGFRRAHVELSRKVLNACHHNNVNRLLHMSALNADATKGRSQYLRTKGEAENNMHAFAGSIQVTSFRPSIIFGDGDSFFNRFARILRLTPWLFPLACGKARFAPVYAGEVAQLFVESINNRQTFNKRIELCGPEIYTLKELVAFTSQQIGKHHIIINLPDTLAQLQAVLLEYFPGKPFSIDNYDSLQVDSICQGGDVFTGKHSIKSIVPAYLGHHNRFSEYDSYRQHARR